MRRAARVDANHAVIVGALRACGAKVHSLAAVGGGVPDLLVWHPATKALRLFEVKDGAKVKSARALTEEQVKWHAEWHGAPIVIVETVEQAVAALVGK